MTTDPVRSEADDAGLTALFAAARAAEPPVPDALMRRVLADAAAHRPAMPPRAVSPAPQRRGWVVALLEMLGGRGAVAGLAAAGLAGVWIGFVQPVDLGGALSLSSAEAVELYPADIEQWADLVAPETVPEG